MKIEIHRKDAITLDINDESTWPDKDADCYIWPKDISNSEKYPVMYFFIDEEVDYDDDDVSYTKKIPMWIYEGFEPVECENGDRYVILTLDKEKATVYKTDDKSTWPEDGDFCVIWPEDMQNYHYISTFSLYESDLPSEEAAKWGEEISPCWYSEVPSPCEDGDKYVIIEVKD